MTRSFVHANTLCLLLVSHPIGEAAGQALIVSGGPSIPKGPMALRRAVGSEVAIALGSEHHRRGFQFRVEFTRARFPTRFSAAETSSLDQGPLTINAGLAYLLYSSAPNVVSIHGGIAAGSYDMKIPGHYNPYGMVPGVGMLFGARFGAGRLRGLLEFQRHAILSDYGNDDFEWSTFTPVRFGFAIQ